MIDMGRAGEISPIIGGLLVVFAVPLLARRGAVLGWMALAAVVVLAAAFFGWVDRMGSPYAAAAGALALLCLGAAFAVGLISRGAMLAGRARWGGGAALWLIPALGVIVLIIGTLWTFDAL